ncbi:MAG: FAD-containing monooxygenase EthA [Chloroflexi bacterium]|nr:FAD-containing monooxygenase EthA [Chloroflexota bacterium]
MNKKIQHIDTIIVGAGIAGIASAYYLKKGRPRSSFFILEALDNFGGTWYTHNYPGVRSDSDLFTFGYSFKPWKDAPIATAKEILKYIGETIEENKLQNHIKYNHKIIQAEWSSREKKWFITADHTKSRQTKKFSCNFLQMCQGYYRQNQGYVPEWKNLKDFNGKFIHTEEWPKNLNYKNKKIIVIGSGATAATTIPVLAKKAKHITMLQRTPTFYRTSTIGTEEIASTLRDITNDSDWIHKIVREQILINQEIFIKRCSEEPEKVRFELLKEIKNILGENFDVEKHFSPSYRPWQQRIALTPDAELFKSIANGDVSVVTDEIDMFTKNGILLKSGLELHSDIIIAATGFNMNVLGDIKFIIDKKILNLKDTITYRGMMFTTVPNLIWTFGYFRQAWTLRAEMIANFMVRLMDYMDTVDSKKITVALRKKDENMKILSWINDEEFNPGYLSRVLNKMPKSGSNIEWVHNQNYWYEKDIIPNIDLSGEEFIYE